MSISVRITSEVRKVTEVGKRAGDDLFCRSNQFDRNVLLQVLGMTKNITDEVIELFNFPPDQRHVCSRVVVVAGHVGKIHQTEYRRKRGTKVVRDFI